MVCEEIERAMGAAEASLNPCFNGIWSASGVYSDNPNVTDMVLILVLMEYGLRDYDSNIFELHPTVLILVLMEYGLRGAHARSSRQGSQGLNPCSNGIWSASNDSLFDGTQSQGLNPCSNGIWSASNDSLFDGTQSQGLNPCFNGIWSASIIMFGKYTHYSLVLILVLMEYGLRVQRVWYD